MLRRLLFCALLGTLAIFYFYPMTSTFTGSWSSKYENWRSRATSYPSPESYVPLRDNLALIALVNSQVEPEGFTLAIFKDKVAVDAMGRMVVLNEADYNGITSLGTEILDLPDTGEFRNTWRLNHRATSQPIDRILIGPELKETSVQGFQKGKTDLKNPVGDIEVLPDSLAELTGLVLEGRKDYERGNEDKAIVQRMKDLVGDVM